jgi:hypothetical protein
MFLLILPRIVEPYLLRQGVNASGIISDLSGGSAVIIVLTIAVTTAIGAVAAGTRYAGFFTIAHGALAGVYFYRLLGGGNLSISVTYHGYPLEAAIGLELMLIFLEASAATSVIQGIVQLARH